MELGKVCLLVCLHLILGVQFVNSDLPVYKPALLVKPGSTSPKFTNRFQNVERNFTEGTDILLSCGVINLDTHHTVSWLRLQDMQVLTVGGLVFSTDPRVKIMVQSGTSRMLAGTWQLRILKSQESDSSVYQCQVNTEPATTLNISVSVIPKLKPSDLFYSDAAGLNKDSQVSDKETQIEILPEYNSSEILGLDWQHSSNQQIPGAETPANYPPNYPAANYPPNTETTKAGLAEEPPEFSGLPADQLEAGLPADSLGPRVSLDGPSRKEYYEVNRTEYPDNEPFPQKSVLNHTPATKLEAQNTSSIEDTKMKGKGKEDDNTLLKPIVSLFSVAAFILILGSLRSCYVKPKDESTDGRRSSQSYRDSNCKTRRCSKKENHHQVREKRGLMSGAQELRGETEIQNKEGDHRYTEIKSIEVPGVEVVPKVPNGFKQQTLSGIYGSRQETQSATYGTRLDTKLVIYDSRTPDCRTAETITADSRTVSPASSSTVKSSQQQPDILCLEQGPAQLVHMRNNSGSTNTFAGINKIGCRRSRADMSSVESIASSYPVTCNNHSITASYPVHSNNHSTSSNSYPAHSNSHSITSAYKKQSLTSSDTRETLLDENYGTLEINPRHSVELQPTKGGNPFEDNANEENTYETFINVHSSNTLNKNKKKICFNPFTELKD